MSPPRRSIWSSCRVRRTSPARQRKCRSRADRYRAIKEPLNLVEAKLSRSPAARGPPGKDQTAVCGAVSEGIVMNGFVKSDLTLALTLCACGRAYAHAHLHPIADEVCR